MASGQQLLFAPEKPLVQRLGRKFFRRIPAQAGVYKMKDAAGQIVYVGKAKDLRQRLQSYRVANPERLGRRHLRLLQTVEHIEFELCAGEAAALQHEARLIRRLKPKFNRAGVWPGRAKFLAWRFTGETVEFAAPETPAPGWERLGPLGGRAERLRLALARLLWLAHRPGTGYARLPPGWSQGRLPEVASIPLPARAADVRAALSGLLWERQTAALGWFVAALETGPTPFDRAAMAQDLAELQGFLESPGRVEKDGAQMALL